MRQRHWMMIVLAIVAMLPIFWFLLAYAGLPRLWSHHERRLRSGRSEIVSYTAQGIPADPINLKLFGSPGQIECAFTRAGWSTADSVSLRSGLKIASSVAFGRSYPQAPVSPLYLRDRVQDLAFQLDEGRSADKRHHVRFWQIGPNDWLGAATFDRGVGLSLFTLQITHHIGPDVDAERDLAASVIAKAGGSTSGIMQSGVAAYRWRRNGGGDRYRTDGLVRVLEFGNSCL